MLEKAEKMRLSDGIDNRNNNLSSVKFIASIMVIVSHAYGFATGYLRTDWFNVVTGGKGDLGALAVNIFFFYSGLLISCSLLRNNDLKRYCKRRFIRIYPSFLLVTLTITFIAAPFVTSLELKDYFTNGETYEYLKNLVFLSRHNLPGVFVNNVYGKSVNGQIWTIRVEVCCYIMCYLFCRTGLLKKKKLLWSVLSYIFMIGTLGVVTVKWLPGLYVLFMPVTMFYVGMIYAMCSKGIILNEVLMWLWTACFGLLCIAGQVVLASIVFLPYILCYIAFAFESKWKLLNYWGECSYEIYLWGGFVAQMIVYMYGGSMSEYVNILITIPISMILGKLTQKVIESGVNT